GCIVDGRADNARSADGVGVSARSWHFMLLISSVQYQPNGQPVAMFQHRRCGLPETYNVVMSVNCRSPDEALLPFWDLRYRCRRHRHSVSLATLYRLIHSKRLARSGARQEAHDAR